MRLHYYKFPEDSDKMIRLKEGCPVILKSHDEIYLNHISENQWCLIDHIGFTLSSITFARAKNLLKRYGGVAWTSYCEGTNGVYRVKEIKLSNEHWQKDDFNDPN